jgi:hypothetical protein
LSHSAAALVLDGNPEAEGITAYRGAADYAMVSASRRAGA